MGLCLIGVVAALVIGVVVLVATTRRDAGVVPMVPPHTPSSLLSPAEVEPELLALLAQNKKIDAIKRLREATGMGLRDAKDWVDQLEASDRGRR